MGLPSDVRASLRGRVTLGDAKEAAYALRCDLPAGATETLLIVDQFEERAARRVRGRTGQAVPGDRGGLAAE